MKRNPSFLKTVALLAAVVYFAGMSVPAFVPRAQALFWEDDYNGNDPKERKSRPGGFFLFNWINSLARKSRESQYGKIENRDTGPSVNGKPRAALVVTSGLVGLGAGLLLAKMCTQNDDNRTSNMFIGGALGLGTGVLVAALIMPRDYQVDPTAQTDFLKYRQAWLQDESATVVRSAFCPSAALITASF